MVYEYLFFRFGCNDPICKQCNGLKLERLNRKLIFHFMKYTSTNHSMCKWKSVRISNLDIQSNFKGFL